jgi:hypothetical protein
MLFLGPVGFAAGSIILSAGVGGISNAYEQSQNDNNEFLVGSFAGHFLVNAVIGGVTAGVGVYLKPAHAAAMST